MAKSKGFELIPQTIPPRRMSSSSFYRRIIDEFLKSNAKSALVGETNRKPATLMQGLRKAVKNDEINDVSIIQRAGEVYITRQ